MPHTRAAKPEALKEASEFQDLLQTHDSSTDSGWNENSDWKLPHLSYQQDCSEDFSAPDLSWYTSEWVATDQPQFAADAWLSTTDAVGYLPANSCGHTLRTDFCGLQHWYSRASQDFSSESFTGTTLAVLSDSICSPYDSTSISDGSQLADQTCGTQSLSPKTSFRPASLSDGMLLREKSDYQTIDLTEELEEPPSPSSAKEYEQISNAKVDANKRRKIAHSVVEKNYRSRIKEGMAELRHCVPSTLKHSSSADSGLVEGQPLTENATQNYPSGKVAILSDAVHYVRALTHRNEALHAQLGVMQRRNNTLQKIALSKVDTNAPPTKAAIDKPEQQGTEQFVERSENLKTKRRSKKLPPDHAHCGSDTKVALDGHSEPHCSHVSRLRASAHPPRLLKRYGSCTKNVVGTPAAIAISKD